MSRERAGMNIAIMFRRTDSKRGGRRRHFHVGFWAVKPGAGGQLQQRESSGLTVSGEPMPAMMRVACGFHFRSISFHSPFHLGSAEQARTGGARTGHVVGVVAQRVIQARVSKAVERGIGDGPALQESSND